jgi:phage terminase large subunit GpA-like protein
MNLKIQDEVAFMAEYQNEPLADKSDEDILMSVDEICQQLNGLKKTIVPLECTKVTMFVDVQKTLLYYCVCAWSDEFTGAVIDYGAWPDQKRTRFTLHDASPTIQDVIKGGFEGQLYKAFESLINEKMQTAYLREDGAEMHIERAMIDANWGLSTDTVYQFCRQSEYSGVVLPAHGRYIGASSRSMTEYKKKKGERLGFNWFMPAVAGKRAIRHVVFDTNFWKSFIHTRLGVLKGDKGSLTLWGKSPMAHQCFAEHLTTEYRVKTVGLGREVDEWKLRPDKSDNHWLDCLAGCAVGASMQGSTLSEFFHITRKDKIKLSEKNKNFYNNTKNDVSQVNENISEEEKNQERKPLKLSDLQKRRR